VLVLSIITSSAAIHWLIG